MEGEKEKIKMSVNERKRRERRPHQISENTDNPPPRHLPSGQEHPVQHHRTLTLTLTVTPETRCFWGVRSGGYCPGEFHHVPTRFTVCKLQYTSATVITVSVLLSVPRP